MHSDLYKTRMNLEFLFLFISHMIHILSATNFATKDQYVKVYEDILQRQEFVYKMPPAVEDIDTTSYPLQFSLKVVDIGEFDEINQIISLTMLVSMRWIHEGLSWNASGYGGTNFVYMDSTKLWKPTILVLLGQKNSLTLDFQENVKLESSGTVDSTKMYDLSFSCEIDFSKYPFDAQTCSIGFYAFGSPKPEVSVRIYPFDFYEIFKKTGEWSIENSECEIVTPASRKFQAFPRFYLTVRRQSTYYIITIIFPMTLTSMMIPLVFLIPAQAGEKISFLVAIFTSTAIFLNFISDVMPRGLSTMPYLAILLIEVLIEGFLATLTTLWVINKFEGENYKASNNSNNSNTINQSSLEGKQDIGTVDSQTQNSALGFWRVCMTAMTARRLDKIFFMIFGVGQTIFLAILFGSTDWLSA